MENDECGDERGQQQQIVDEVRFQQRGTPIVNQSNSRKIVWHKIAQTEKFDFLYITSGCIYRRIGKVGNVGKAEKYEKTNCL